jgi:hypothetical protein
MKVAQRWGSPRAKAGGRSFGGIGRKWGVFMSALLNFVATTESGTDSVLGNKEPPSGEIHFCIRSQTQSETEPMHSINWKQLRLRPSL